MVKGKGLGSEQRSCSTWIGRRPIEGNLGSPYLSHNNIETQNRKESKDGKSKKIQRQCVNPAFILFT